MDARRTLALMIALPTLVAAACDGGSADSADSAGSAGSGVAPGVPVFDLQGHRGARGHHPENTRHAFREALAIGVTTLEMDVGVTKDGVVVVHHDEGLSAAIARDPNGRWVQPPTPLLRSLTWQESQRFDVGRMKPGSVYAARFPLQKPHDGLRIPRLSDVLSDAEAIAGGAILYDIETKLTPEHPRWTLSPEALAEALVHEIRAAGVAKRTLIQSFDWRTLRYLAEAHPDLQTACLTTEQPHEDTVRRAQPGPSPWTAGLDVDDFEGSVPHLVRAAACTVWSPFHGDLNPADLARAHELGLRVIPWTANEPEEIEALIDWGVDGIISDYPDRVRAALEVRGLPLPARFHVGG